MAAPSGPSDLRAVSERIAKLLDELTTVADPRLRERAEELVRLVTELYGAGLERVVDVVAGAPGLHRALADDPVVGDLLLLHGLHPDSLTTRVEQALESVRPMLAQHKGGVELLDIDEEVGAVHLRLLGSCDGCPSSAATLQGAVEVAIVEAAPEIVVIDVEQPALEVPSSPVALITKPVYEACPTEVVSVG